MTTSPNPQYGSRRGARLVVLTLLTDGAPASDAMR